MPLCEHPPASGSGDRTDRIDRHTGRRMVDGQWPTDGRCPVRKNTVAWPSMGAWLNCMRTVVAAEELSAFGMALFWKSAIYGPLPPP